MEYYCGLLCTVYVLMSGYYLRPKHCMLFLFQYLAAVGDPATIYIFYATTWLLLKTQVLKYYLCCNIWPLFTIISLVSCCCLQFLCWYLTAAWDLDADIISVMVPGHCLQFLCQCPATIWDQSAVIQTSSYHLCWSK